MGIKLYTEVLDHAPAELSSPELVVLLVLAEDANDVTRTGWPGMEKLCHRARLSASGVRRVFGLLAARGLEVRVPLAEDKHGRPVFAVRGKQTMYRIPEMAKGDSGVSPSMPSDNAAQESSDAAKGDSGVSPNPEKAATPQAPKAGKGDTDRGERRQESGPKVTQDCHPSPQVPSESPQPPQPPRWHQPVDDRLYKYGEHPSTVAEPLRTVWKSLLGEDPTVTLDEAIETRKLFIEQRKPKTPQYYQVVANGGGFSGYLAEVRAKAAADRRKAFGGELRDAEPCEHGQPGGKTLTTTAGEPLCVFCRHGLADPVRSKPATPPEQRAVLTAYGNAARLAGQSFDPQLMIRVTSQIAEALRGGVEPDVLAAIAASAGAAGTDVFAHLAQLRSAA